MPIKFNPFTGTFDFTRDLTATAPLVLTGDALTLDHNTTNLKITASQLNTIQDIATASAPTFLNLTLGNSGATDPTITFDATNDGSIKWDTSDECFYLLSNGATGYLSSLLYEAGVSCSTDVGAGLNRYALQAWARPSGAAAIMGGFWGGVSEAATSYSVGEIYGGTFYNEMGGTSVRTITTLCANYAANYYYGSNLSCTTVRGLYISAVEGGATFSGTVTEIEGIRIGPASFAGTCTTLYGLRIDTQSGGTTTYGVFMQTAGNISFRAGTQAIWSSAASTLDLTANTTFNFKIAANPATGVAGTIYAKLNATGLALLMGTATPTYAISISGDAARQIWMERHLTSNTAGNILTVQSGGATSGATNKAGGKLVLSSGISTGTQSSSVEIWTAAGGSSGTTDRTPSVKLSVAGTGAVVSSATSSSSVTGFTHNVTSTSASTFLETKGQGWNYSHSGLTDSSLIGLQMQLTGTVGASDTGGSVITGFAFEVYEAGTGVGAPASAVGGFVRHSSTLGGYTYTVYSADIQVNTGAGAADLTLYETGVSSIGANTTSWTAFHAADPVPTAGTLTTAYGLKIEEITTATNKYGIWIGGGTGIHFRQAGEKVYSSAADTLDLDSVTTINSRIGGTVKLALATSTLTFSDAVNIAVNGTTGTKIGTATTQKLSLWNATPIVQPTTAVAAATFVANTSAIVNDTATFDGYTIGQVVKALRNMGVLA